MLSEANDSSFYWSFIMKNVNHMFYILRWVIINIHIQYNMNIQEERTYILSESNTAQKSIIDLLEIMHSKTITELNVIDELSGDIDFSILSSLGFNNIQLFK